MRGKQVFLKRHNLDTKRKTAEKCVKDRNNKTTILKGCNTAEDFYWIVRMNGNNFEEYRT